MRLSDYCETCRFWWASTNKMLEENGNCVHGENAIPKSRYDEACENYEEIE